MARPPPRIAGPIAGTARPTGLPAPTRRSRTAHGRAEPPRTGRRVRRAAATSAPDAASTRSAPSAALSKGAGGPQPSPRYQLPVDTGRLVPGLLGRPQPATALGPVVPYLRGSVGGLDVAGDTRAGRHGRRAVSDAITPLAAACSLPLFILGLGSAAWKQRRASLDGARVAKPPSGIPGTKQRPESLKTAHYLRPTSTRTSPRSGVSAERARAVLTYQC